MNNNMEPKMWTSRTYDRLATVYDFMMRLFFPVGERGRETIVERVKSGSILDVACGTGTLLALAKKKGLICHGIDLSKGMLNQTQAKVPDAELKIASFYSIPYPEGSFDYVVETNALSGEFINPAKVIEEMIRVCKKGGEIYIAERPITPGNTILDKLIIKLGRLNEDAPKDYIAIFGELGYTPDVEVLDKRYHVFGIKKKS